MELTAETLAQLAEKIGAWREATHNKKLTDDEIAAIREGLIAIGLDEQTKHVYCASILAELAGLENIKEGAVVAAFTYKLRDLQVILDEISEEQLSDPKTIAKIDRVLELTGY